MPAIVDLLLARPAASLSMPCYCTRVLHRHEVPLVFSFRYLLFRHGYLFLFLYVVAVQIGMPIPADPLMLVMGAMVGDHRYSFVYSLVTALVACLTGDCLSYQFGRLKGRSVLGVLCKLSLEPDRCVRKTEALFAKRGARTLLFSKFLPGTSLLSTALAGVTKCRCGVSCSLIRRAAVSGPLRTCSWASYSTTKSTRLSFGSDCSATELASSR